MSKAEILAELPKLAPEDLAEIQTKIESLAGDGWLDTDAPLTFEQKDLLEARLVAYEMNPNAGSSWDAVEARLHARLKQ